jgi:SAM-dependent methyltransferase
MGQALRRRVEPELLDSLPHDDAAAMMSRQDLARINKVMGAQARMAERLRALPQPRTLVDLGSGDGRFLLGVARRLDWYKVKLVVLDRQDIVSVKTRRAFNAIGWQCEVVTGDIFETLPRIESGAVITANLFLHHFDDPALEKLLRLAAEKCAAFIACEPRRAPSALFASKLVGLIGANAVTRHDAVVSVRAGFAGQELSQAWPEGPWRKEEDWCFPFSHCFSAVRQTPS